MSRSKLEEYLSILEALTPKPLEPKKISLKAKIEYEMLKKRLDFLVLHRLVEKRSFEKERTICTITDTGMMVLKTLRAEEHLERIYQSILRTCIYEPQIHVYP